MAAVTRLGLYGGPRGLYGDFSTKEEGTPVVEDVFFFGPDHDFKNDDDIILAIIKDFVRRAA